MSTEFQNLMTDVEQAIQNRTISFARFRGKAEEKARMYDAGTYSPIFQLVIDSKKKLECIWCSDISTKEIKDHLKAGTYIARITGRIYKEGFTPEEWDSVTLKVMHSLNLQL